MLLRTDYDHAHSRIHLFAGCQSFAKKVVLTQRIIWFDGPKANPSYNHAWYIWNHEHRRAASPRLCHEPNCIRSSNIELNVAPVGSSVCVSTAVAAAAGASVEAATEQSRAAI
jgi:hypothetical protein